MARAELQMVGPPTGPMLLIILISVCTLSAGTNRLAGIGFDPKQNGLIVELEFEAPMSPDSISAWQAGSGWFYFTLYNVEADSAELSVTRVPKEIVSFQPIVSTGSTQLGIRLRQPIEQYDIIGSDDPGTLLANLHYSTERFADLPAVAGYQQREREFSSLFARARSWLYVTGAGLTMTGLMKTGTGPAKDNWELRTGIVTLVATYILDKLWAR